MNLKAIAEFMQIVSTVGLGIFIPVWYFLVIEPNSRKALKEFAREINAEKEYVEKDFTNIAPVSIENTILRINRRIDLIVDRNSISDNIIQIECDIKILIDRETESGRSYLKSLGFKQNILTPFFTGTDKQKEKSNTLLKNHFIEAAKELSEIDKNKKIFRENARDCHQDWRDILDAYDEFEEHKKKAYTKLKREIWNVFETNIYEIQQKINSLKGV